MQKKLGNYNSGRYSTTQHDFKTNRFKLRNDIKIEAKTKLKNMTQIQCNYIDKKATVRKALFILSRIVELCKYETFIMMF